MLQTFLTFLLGGLLLQLTFEFREVQKQNFIGVQQPKLLNDYKSKITNSEFTSQRAS